jgi:hypothetical protein
MKPIHQRINDLIVKMGDVNAEIAKKLSERSEKPISPQRIGQYRKGLKTPGADFLLLWKEVFGDDLNETGAAIETKVSLGAHKLTPAMKSSDNNETGIRGHVYTELIEKNSDYKLMPTMILTDYSIIPKRILDGHDKEIARQETLISKYEGLISRLEKEIESLRSQLTPKNAQ